MKKLLLVLAVASTVLLAGCGTNRAEVKEACTDFTNRLLVKQGLQDSWKVSDVLVTEQNIAIITKESEYHSKTVFCGISGGLLLYNSDLNELLLLLGKHN